MAFMRRPPTEIEGLGQNLDEHHQIPRLDDDQAERCDGNLRFAGQLIAVLSMTGLGRDRFSRRANSILAVAQTVGFGLRRSKMLDLSMGTD